MKNLILILACTALVSLNASAQKLTAEQVVARSLDSIAKSSERAKLKSIVAIGQANYSKTVGDRLGTQGRAVIASEAGRSAFAMAFRASSYPQEKITFDGKEVTIAFATPGARSPFGGFLQTFRDVVTDGLLGGTLMRNWLLYDAANASRGKLTVEGLKKIDGKDVYAVSYIRKGGSDLDVRLYFDKETFRHVRTEYKRVFAAPMGPTPELSARQSETRYGLVEDFSDFKTEYGVTLPRKYTIRFSADNGRTTSEYTYTLEFANFYYNQELDADTFSGN
ncbi:MAG: hypothetical protein ACK4S4_08485 [Pyrinomonadaceae bacterium]